MRLAFRVDSDPKTTENGLFAHCRSGGCRRMNSLCPPESRRISISCVRSQDATHDNSCVQHARCRVVTRKRILYIVIQGKWASMFFVSAFLLCHANGRIRNKDKGVFFKHVRRYFYRPEKKRGDRKDFTLISDLDWCIPRYLDNWIQDTCPFEFTRRNSRFFSMCLVILFTIRNDLNHVRMHNTLFVI